MSRSICAALALIAVLTARTATAEPTFLAKHETRCSACHYSPTGGGLLNDYGRLMSRQEISSTSGDREGFLWGALGDSLGPVHLGIDVRPAHLHIAYPGGSFGNTFVMNADVIGAYQDHGWTLYGEVGHRPELAGGGLYSYEYWGARDLENGWSIRAGRFLPAYGVRFADHTAFNRAGLGFDKYDQVYGVEISQTSGNRLVQISGGPGRAESVLNEPGHQAFTTSGRVQFDLRPTTVLVASGIFRTASETVARNGSTGAAFGFSPASRVTNWTEADAVFKNITDGRSLVFVNETAVEAVPGLWLKFSPQVRTGAATSITPGVTRLALAATFLPRTHFNVDVSYYHDRTSSTKVVTHTSLVQLHIYL
jgi:hypothetical protein